jgi:hypothetical protein
MTLLLIEGTDQVVVVPHSSDQLVGRYALGNTLRLVLGL